MTFTADTITILKNFAAINPSIKFNKGTKKAGSILRTISSEQTIVVDCKITDFLPKDFCVFDLRQFLAVLDLFKNPDLNFENDKFILVKESGGKSSVKFFLTTQDMITVPNDDLSGLVDNISKAEIKFTLLQADIASILKAAGILSSKNIAVIGTSENISVATLDQKNQTSNSYIQEVAEGNGDEFTMIFNVDNIKILPGSYEVSICSAGLSAFKNTEMNLVYYIALEDSSVYNANSASA